MDLSEQLQQATARLAALEAANARLRERIAACTAGGEGLQSYILNAVPQSIFWKDRHGVYLGCNAQFAETVGIAQNEIVGKTDFDLPWPRGEAETYRDDDEEVMATRQPKRHIVEPLQRADGTRLWIDTTKIPLLDANGNVYGVFGVYEDITERKQTLEALAESRNMLQLVLDTIPVRVFWKDRDLYYLGGNRLLIEDTGFTSLADLIGKTDYDTTARAQADRYRHDDREVIDSGIAKLNFEEPQTTKTGDIAWLRTWKIPLRDTNGQIIGVLGVYEDITENKRTEQALRQSEARLRSILETAPTGIGIVVDRQLVDVNDQIVQMTGYTRDELIGCPSRILYPAQADYDYVGQEKYRQIRELGTGTVETHWQRKDGTVFDVLMSSTPLDPADLSAGVTFTALDITARKEADRAKTQFLMVLSHEMKTPLTSILGWAQAALSMPEQTPQALSVIVRNAKEQARILDDLLDVSRLVTGRFSLHPEPHELWESVHQCVENAMQPMQSHGLTLHEEPPTVPLPVVVDAGRIRQAIGNLLTNAIKYTASGGQIWVRAYRRGDEAVIEVQDTGRGIAPDDLSTLFKPFLQLRREEGKGGLGLGLSLVKGIIEMHGGHVQADSPGLEQGSTFTITLPIRRT